MFLILFGLLRLDATTYAQNMKVNLECKDVLLSEVMEILKEQTKLDFFYSNKELDVNKKVSISAKEEMLESVLRKILGDGYRFRVEDNIVIIRPVKDDEKKASQETVTVKGVIRDTKGQPLPGVTVALKGVPLGTASDVNGRFSLPVPKEEGKPIVLVFSFIGMKTQELTYKEPADVAEEWVIVMEETSTELEEVVSTGYQNFDRKHLTSAVTSLKMDDIMVPGLNSVDQMLEGRVPGMIFMQNSGQVGASPRLRIRGTSTVLGNQEPLWVVDGVVVTDPVNVSAEQINDLDFVNLLGNAIAGLNPNDIEQIDVLKDAAATAVYGTKAANGVIVITTKKGHVGKPQVTYSFTGGIKRRPRYTMRGVDVMNSRERMEYSREIVEKQMPYNSMSAWVGYEGALRDYYNGKISFAEMKEQMDYYETVNTDWFKIIFRDSFSHSHSLNVSGGTDKVKYYVSLGYSYDAGTLKKEFMKRYTLSSNLNLTFGKLYVAVGISGNVQDKQYTPSDIGLQDYAYNTSRAVPAYDENGDLLFYQRQGNQSRFFYPFNVLNERDNSSDEMSSNSMGVNLKADYNFAKNWRVGILASYNVSNTNRQVWFGEKTTEVGMLGYRDPETLEVPDEWKAYSECPVGGILEETTDKNESYTGRIEVNYNRYLDADMKHNISASAFWEVSSTKYTGMDYEMRGYMKDRGMLISPVSQGVYPLYDEWRLEEEAAYGDRTYTINNKVAGILTVMYSYEDKYILNANMRVDASNKFGNKSNSRLLPIWSVSGRWNMKEDILAGVPGLDDMAFRVSFGYQGNMLDDQSPELIIRKHGQHAFYNKLYSTIEKYPNPNLRWEKTLSFNAGIDFSIFKGKFSGTLSAFYRKTTNAYMDKVISRVNGTQMYTINSGTIRNSGVEFNFRLQPFNNLDFSQGGEIRGFSWRIDPQIGSVFNQLLNKLNKDKRVLEEADYEALSYTDYLNGSVPIEGRPMNAFYSYKFKGLDPKDGRPMFYDIEEEHRAEYGQMTKDQLYQTVMEYTGTRQPFLQGGVSSTMQWRRLIFSFNFSYSFGSKVRLLQLYPNVNSGSGTMAVAPEQNLQGVFVDRWRRPGDEKHTNIPGILDNKAFTETLSPWFSKVTSTKNALASGIAPFPYTFASNIWQMYDNSNVRVSRNDYFKLQSISFRYVVPESFLKKFGISSAYVTASGSNLFTIASKGLKGQEPTQSGSAGNISVPVPAMYNLSFSVSF